MKAASRDLAGWLVFTIVLVLGVWPGSGAPDPGAAAATAPLRAAFTPNSWSRVSIPITTGAR